MSSGKPQARWRTALSKPMSHEGMRFGLDMYIATWQYSHMGMNVNADRLSVAFAALADPTRRAILARLASGEADVSELMKPFALSQPRSEERRVGKECRSR